MDVSADNRVDIESVGSVEVAVGNAADVVVADDHALDITITKKEYKIVGDEVYIAKLYDDAPQWMKDLVQLVVDNTMETESVMLRNDLIGQLNQFATSYVPLNQYTQSILDLSNADTSMHATLETLNSNFNDGLDTANSQIIDLQSTKASKTEVVTKVIETLTAQLATPTSELGATIGNLQQTIVDGDSANADSVTMLMSVLEGEVDARASAIEYLNTYVGINDSGVATGLGLLADLSILQKQNDGVIETYTGTYDVMLNAAASPADDDELVITAEPYATWKANELVGSLDTRLAHIGDVYIKYEVTATGAKSYIGSYKFIKTVPDETSPYSTDNDGFTWALIIDQAAQDAYEQALNAYELADGKITAYFAIEQLTAPSAPGDTITTISGKLIKVPYYWYDTTSSTLKQRVGSSWVAVVMTDANDGDQLQTMKVDTTKLTVDYYIREYNHASTPSWVERTPNGLVATSEWGVNLDAYLGGRAVGGGTSLVNDITATDSDLGKAVNSRFAYNSTLNIDGVTYNSGFGLVSDLVGEVGNVGSIPRPPTGTSEFWVQADKFKMIAASQTAASQNPFSVNATTGEITFNGKVSFNSVTGAPITLTGKLYTTSTQNTTGLAVGTYVMKYDYSLLQVWQQVGQYTYMFIAVTPAIGSTFIANVAKDAAGSETVINPNQVFTYNGSVWVKGAMSTAEIISSINGSTNTTTIDGGKITTGSIRSNQMFANRLVNISAYNGDGSINESAVTMDINLGTGYIYIK